MIRGGALQLNDFVRLGININILRHDRRMARDRSELDTGLSESESVLHQDGQTGRQVTLATMTGSDSPG